MKIEQFKSSQKGNLTQNQFFKPKHELNGIFEASVLSGSGIHPIPHYPHPLHGSNGSGFEKLEKITMQIEFEKMKPNHINTALFSLANLHTPCR
jgi:hypothetical protein